MEIRDIRAAAGLSQLELAERTGVAQPNLAAYESGRRRPSDTMLTRIRAAAPPKPSWVAGQCRDAILEAAGRHHARDVRVFGSAARGDDVSGSDLDLLVRFEPTADVFDLAELIDDIRDITGIRVDVVSEAGLSPGRHPIRDEARPL